MARKTRLRTGLMVSAEDGSVMPRPLRAMDRHDIAQPSRQMVALSPVPALTKDHCDIRDITIIIPL
jgi:hypothetical protein